MVAESSTESSRLRAGEQCASLPSRAGRRRACRPALAALLSLVLVASPWAGRALAAEAEAAGITPVRPEVLSVSIGGRSTRVDVYIPPDDPDAAAGAAVVIAHGFARTRNSMAGHGRALAAAGHWVLVPDLPYVLDSRDNARALRELLALLRAGERTPRLERFLLVGFSAGGLAALLATDAPGVVGYVGLDPFDRPGGVGLEAARQLTAPAWVVRAPPAACNAYAIAAPWLEVFPQLIEDRLIEGASHCDFESPTDVVCRLVCGGTEPAHQAVVSEVLLAAARQSLGPALRQTRGPGTAITPPRNAGVIR